MACADTLLRPGTERGELERVRYFPRQLLTADDMRIEQEYFRDKQRRHNRFLHGWGVVCGLEVRADPDAGPLIVKICPGYALGPFGDEIYVPEPVTLNLDDCSRPAPDPCNPDGTVMRRGPVDTAATSLRLAVLIRYAECPTRPTRTLPAGCGCDETGCEYARIRDGFEVRCRVKPDDVSEQEPPPTICDVEADRQNKVPPVPKFPSDPWIELAAITLAAGTGESGRDRSIGGIDNGTRRLVYSTAMLQQQVIQCCCQSG